MLFLTFSLDWEIAQNYKLQVFVFQVNISDHIFSEELEVIFYI